MTGVIATIPRIQFSNALGIPLAGGKLYTYLAGTTTLEPTYQDEDLTSANENPITLDSTGSCMIWLNPDKSYKFLLKSALGITQPGWPVDNISGASNLTSLQPTLSLYAKLTALAAAAGASLMGFIQAGVGAVAQTVQDALRERVSVTQFMSQAQRADVLSGAGTLDVSAAIQRAIDYGGDNALIEYPTGNCKLASSVVPRPGQLHMSRGTTITVASGVTAFSRTTDGFPGRIKFKRFRFVGTGNTGRAIAMTNNTPMVSIEENYFTGFNEPIVLDGSYSSVIARNHITGNNFGPILLNETHATALDDNFIDANTYAGVCINGDPVNGARGTTPMHNITIKAGAYQHTQFGVWAENCYELQLLNLYHEGNTKADVRLGVADSGAYNRACYNFTIDGWASSSACSLGRNIIIEHAVNGNMRGLAFNDGTSNTAAVLSADGFSDLLNIDYHRVQHTVFAPGIPFSLPSARVIIAHNGRRTVPMSMKANRFGNLEQVIGDLWGTFTSGSRPLVQLETAGTGYDVSIKSYDLVRFRDSGDNDRLTIDHLNQRINTSYTFQAMTDGGPSLGGTTNRFAQVFAVTGTINTSDERDKTEFDAIPQAWLDAWADVQWCRFKFKDAVAKKANGARWHIGVIAQRVKAAFEAHGIDPFEIGLLCYDEWPEQTDVDDNVTPAGDRYGIRYEEALALECAYLRSKLST